MKKNTVMTVAVLLILTVSLYFVATTYANYGEEASSNTQVSIAKWNVKFNDKSSDGVSRTFPLKVSSSTDVADGKIAPGMTASGTVVLDLTDTEVAVDVSATVNTEQLATDLGVDVSNITAEVKLNNEKIDNGTKKTISLPQGGKFENEDAKKNITIEVKWTSGADDTTIGKNKGDENIEIPVTLKVEQHTGA